MERLKEGLQENSEKLCLSYIVSPGSHPMVVLSCKIASVIVKLLFHE